MGGSEHETMFHSDSGEAFLCSIHTAPLWEKQRLVLPRGLSLTPKKTRTKTRQVRAAGVGLPRKTGQHVCLPRQPQRIRRGAPFAQLRRVRRRWRRWRCSGGGRWGGRLGRRKRSSPARWNLLRAGHRGDYIHAAAAVPVVWRHSQHGIPVRVLLEETSVHFDECRARAFFVHNAVSPAVSAEQDAVARPAGAHSGAPA